MSAMPVVLNPMEPASMMVSASLAKVLSSVVDDTARMQRTSMGSWARKRARRRVLGSALRDSMWRRRLEGFLSPRPDKDRSSMSLEAWVFPKALMRGAFSTAYLSLVGGDRIMVSTSPAVTLSRAATTLVKSAVMTGLRVWN